MIHRFEVGGLRLVVVSDGQPRPPWEPPLPSFFTPETGVPTAELVAAVAAEGLGRDSIACGYNCLVVESQAGLAVIDTGLGPNFVDYGPALEPEFGRLRDGLEEAGFSAADVSGVLFTHLHRDHVRGASDGSYVSFPNARHLASRPEVSFWTGHAANDVDAKSAQAVQAFGGRLAVFDYGDDALPGIRALGAEGHTPGHTLYLIGSGDDQLLCVADTFYDPLQVSHPNWWTPWDLDPATSVKSRARVLDLVAERAVLVHAYHMPFPGLGWIERVGTGFRWLPSSGRHYREDAVRSFDYDPIDVPQGRSLDPHGRVRKDLD